MATTLIDVVSGNASNNNTSAAFTVQAGDLVVVVCGGGDKSTNVPGQASQAMSQASSTGAAVSGTTFTLQGVRNTDPARVSVWTRFWTGSNTQIRFASSGFNGQGNHYTVAVFRGVDSNESINIGTISNPGTSRAISEPTPNAGWSSFTYLAFWSHERNGNFSSPAPTGFTIPTGGSISGNKHSQAITYDLDLTSSVNNISIGHNQDNKDSVEGAIVFATAAGETQETAVVGGAYSVQNSEVVSGDYSVQVSTPVSADYSVQSTLSNQVVANYGLKSSTEIQSDYSVLVEESVSADYSVQNTPSTQVAADYGVQSSTEVQSDYGVRVEESVSASYEVDTSTVESTQVSASYALQVSDDVQADYGVKVSSEVGASYGLQLSPDVTADYSVQRSLSDQVDSDYAVRKSSPVSASYGLTVSRDVLGDYGVQSESTVQSDYAIANFQEIGASYAVDDGITNASVTLLDTIPIQSVGTAQTTLSFSAIGQSQFAGQSLVIALVGVGEFRNSTSQNWNVNHPFFSHSPSMDEVTNTLSTSNSTAPEFVHSGLNFSLSENFCYLAYRQIEASDTFKTYDVTVDIPYNSSGNFVGGVLLRVNNGVIPSSWPKHRHQINLNTATNYTTPSQNYDANSLILTLISFHDDESGGVVTPEKGIEELYQSNVVNKGGQSSPRGLIVEEPVGNSALTNRSQVFTLPTGLAPPTVRILSFNFEIQAGETQTQQVSAEYVVQGASTTSVITGSYGVGGTDATTATYSVQSTDTVAVGSDYAVKPEAAVSADYAVTTSDQVAGDYALQVQQPVSGSYGVTNSEEVDGDYAVLNSRIVTANYLVATANVEFASVTASYGVTAETEVGATYGVGQSAQVDADYAVLNEPSVSADYGVQVQSPVSASYALHATESVGATFSVQNTQAVESDYAVKNSEQVTGEYFVQQLDVQGQVSASYDVGVPQVRNIGASYAVSGQTTVNQETVLGEYVVRNDAYVAEKALRQLGYLKQRTK